MRSRAEPGEVALVGRLPRLALAQPRVGLGHLDHPAQEEAELDRCRHLAPQRAVVVEHGDPLLGRQARVRVGDARDEVEHRVARRSLVPQRQRLTHGCSSPGCGREACPGGRRGGRTRVPRALPGRHAHPPRRGRCRCAATPVRHRPLRRPAPRRRHPHLAHRERDDERHGRRVAGAGVAVRRERDVDPSAEQPAGVGVGRTGRELDTGEQGRDRRAGRTDQGLDVGVGEEGAVVDAGGAELDGEADPGPAESWLPCTRRPRPARAPAVEHAARLVLGEGVRRRGLAEHVDPAGERRARLEHRSVTRSR